MGKSMTPEERGAKAAEIARKEVLKLCKTVKLTPTKTLQRIVEGLDAHDTKASYDKDRGKWVYSAPMTDWSARSKAIDQAICILDMKPVERKALEIDIAGDIPSRIIAAVKGITDYAHQE